MSPSGFSPVVGRALLAVAVFTLASWVLIAGALVLWAPGRSLAAGAVSRVARAATATPAAAPLAAAALADLVMPCGNTSSYGYDTSPGAQAFGWCLIEGDGQVWVDDGGSNRGRFNGRTSEPRFWFRDHDSEYVVRDPPLVEEVREATRPLRAVSEQMGALGAEMEREQSEHGAEQPALSHRMSELSARHHDVLRDVRAKVRAISERARREGKAERPHANA